MTTTEHLDRIGYALELTSRTTTAHQEALESLTALRAHVTTQEEQLNGISVLAAKFVNDSGLTLADLFTPLQFTERLMDRLEELERKQGSPSTDTELEALAFATLRKMGWSFPEVNQRNEATVILAALKSVRDANSGSPSIPSPAPESAANR